MLLDLKGFLNGGNRELQINTSLDFTDEEYYGEKFFSAPVKVVGTVSNKADVTKLLLNCTVSLEKPCDRCGTVTAKEILVVIDRVLVNELACEEHDDIILVENDKLDLYDLCLGEILLSLPIKYLCSDDCKGVCTMCGTNLNEAECKCQKKSIDPRLEALAKLLEDDEDMSDE